jgi:transketolase
MTNLVSRTTLANALRVLAMDAVQQANSGYPGMPRYCQVGDG